MTKVQIRKAEEKDYPFILRVNKENVEVLSPMNEERLRKFAEFAELVLMVEVDGQPAAFLIALREGVDAYDSENYRWFSKTFERFLYIDRIVIDEPFRGQGLGRRLYLEVFSHAQRTGVFLVTAEIDTIPYNATSLNFHKTMGFREVGTQVIRGGTIQVSLCASTQMRRRTCRDGVKLVLQLAPLGPLCQGRSCMSCLSRGSKWTPSTWGVPRSMV